MIARASRRLAAMPRRFRSSDDDAPPAFGEARRRLVRRVPADIGDAGVKARETPLRLAPVGRALALARQRPAAAPQRG